MRAIIHKVLSNTLVYTCALIVMAFLYVFPFTISFATSAVKVFLIWGGAIFLYDIIVNRVLFQKKIFWVVMLMMTCAGASEQAVSQWASTFAEEGLKVSKTVGDLAGPMAFAFLMGLARLLYGKYGEKIDLKRFMTYSSILCVISYLCISFVPNPLLSLLGCAICGFSVGIMWPGTLSISSKKFPAGGTAMFALLAMAGDLGGSIGPGIVGRVTQMAGDNIRSGMLVGLIFPVVMVIGLLFFDKIKSR